MKETDFELHPNPNPRSAEERQKAMQNLGFGRLFTEHMVSLRYREGQGWYDGKVEPYAPIMLDPASSGLHYGQAIFEGFKAYSQASGQIATFRPDANARRFNASARRLAMPELPTETFVGAADALVRTEREWVPKAEGESLYLRPLMFATEPALGVRPSREYLFLVFGSPSASYFQQGVKPLSVWLCKDFVRAAPGGTGEAKCAGNYAASLVAQRSALEQGCQQVVWLDAHEHRYVEEMGGMNLFFAYKDVGGIRLVTPKLTGALLPGITRDSILTLAPELGYAAEEGSVSVSDWISDLESGRLSEVFACGTAAVVTPVGRVQFEGGSFAINGGESGPVAVRIREHLLAIQHGRIPDRHDWVHPVV